jgi:hypothetical protein
MRGQHRFLQTHNGITSFAHAEVQATSASVEEIVDRLPKDPNAAEGEVNRQSAAALVDVALDGIHDAVAHARVLGVALDNQQLAVVKLLGAQTDTSEDARYAVLLPWRHGQPSQQPDITAAEDGLWR